MKKMTLLLLALGMIFVLAGCGADTAGGESTGEAAASASPQKQQTGGQHAARILVAYFSPTHSTERLAEYAAEELQADLYAINPAVPYTAADLDYHNDSSRSTLEMHDAGSRPAIAAGVENMQQYDIVLIGYPIWWGEAPRIVSTFVESYDFAGKTVIPFCTSAASDMGSSAENLARLTKGADWLPGRRFGADASREDVAAWVNGLGVKGSAQ